MKWKPLIGKKQCDQIGRFLNGLDSKLFLAKEAKIWKSFLFK